MPWKDSRPGIEALALAHRAGVSLVHSNPKLGTQWAIREAMGLAAGPPVRHLIKAEAPLDAGEETWARRIEDALQVSCSELDVEGVDTLVWELDLKNTRDRTTLGDDTAVRDFFVAGSVLARRTGRVESVVAYSHSPRHLLAAAAADGIDGLAAQYNLAEPWPALYLPRLHQAGLTFLGMSPLRRGILAQGRPAEAGQEALRWALADPRVAAAVVTLSTTDHVRAALTAASDPLPPGTPRETAWNWLRRLGVDQNPQEGAPITSIHSDPDQHRPGRP